MTQRHNQQHDHAQTPIPARAAITVFETATQHERLEAKPAAVQAARRFITGIYQIWLRISVCCVRRMRWYQRVEPYIGYGTNAYSRLVCRTVFGPAHRQPGVLMRGIRSVFGVPAPHVRVKIAIDGVPVHTVQVGTSEVYDKVDCSRDSSDASAVSDMVGFLDLVAERQLSTGVHEVSYRVQRRKPVTAHLYTIAEGTKVGIISDVDDTIMVTQAPVIWKAAYNLLFLNPKKRSIVPGMNVLYSKIAEIFPDAPFFYLSTSPWNVESSIRNFIEAHGYPLGPLLLRDLDPRPKTFVPSGVQHKLEFTEQLMADFPDMKFILMGDDGQQDPTTYATIAKRYPGRVLAIGIRQLATAHASRFGVARLANTDVPVTDVPVFTGTTGANLIKTMLPFLRQCAQAKVKKVVKYGE